MFLQRRFFEKVKGSEILLICVFDLRDSSFCELNKEEPEAEGVMILRNYLPVDTA
jgi:hypothetical protein